MLLAVVVLEKIRLDSGLVKNQSFEAYERRGDQRRTVILILPITPSSEVVNQVNSPE